MLLTFVFEKLEKLGEKLGTAIVIDYCLLTIGDLTKSFGGADPSTALRTGFLKF